MSELSKIREELLARGEWGGNPCPVYTISNARWKVAREEMKAALAARDGIAIVFSHPDVDVPHFLFRNTPIAPEANALQTQTKAKQTEA